MAVAKGQHEASKALGIGYTGTQRLIVIPQKMALPTLANEYIYDRIRESKDGRTLVESFEVPIRTGRARQVPAGPVFRVTTPVGPQVGDFNIWNANDTRERLWTARTRQLQGAHVTTYDRLWSILPFLRPLVTITDDSLASYGIDEHAGRLHRPLCPRGDP